MSALFYPRGNRQRNESFFYCEILTVGQNLRYTSYIVSTWLQKTIRRFLFLFFSGLPHRNIRGHPTKYVPAYAVSWDDHGNGVLGPSRSSSRGFLSQRPYYNFAVMQCVFPNEPRGSRRLLDA